MPSIGWLRIDSSRFGNLPEARRISIFPFWLTTAMPAESYPRYSRRRSPSRIRGTTFLGPIYPTMPHTMNSPKEETGGKVLLDQGNTGFRKALYVSDGSFLALNPSGHRQGQSDRRRGQKGRLLVLIRGRQQFLAGAGHRDRFCVPNMASVSCAEGLH